MVGEQRWLGEQVWLVEQGCLWSRVFGEQGCLVTELGCLGSIGGWGGEWNSPG